MSNRAAKSFERDELLAAAKLVLESGAEITVPGRYGEAAFVGHSVPPDELLLWVTDQMRFYAKKEGVSVEKLKLWDAFLDSGGRCTALTQSGAQCKNQLTQGEYPEDVCRFIFGEHDKCRVHKGLNAFASRF